jgi:hypothetical protein
MKHLYKRDYIQNSLEELRLLDHRSCSGLLGQCSWQNVSGHTGSPVMESEVAILEEEGSLEPEDPGSAGAVVTRRLTGGLGGYTAILCTTALA